jgi:hypothetical protein
VPDRRRARRPCHSDFVPGAPPHHISCSTVAPVAERSLRVFATGTFASLSHPPPSHPAFLGENRVQREHGDRPVPGRRQPPITAAPARAIIGRNQRRFRAYYK